MKNTYYKCRQCNTTWETEPQFCPNCAGNGYIVSEIEDRLITLEANVVILLGKVRRVEVITGRDSSE